MAGLNLSGLKLMDEPLNTEVLDNTIKQESISIQNETSQDVQVETNKNSGGFAISLSSLIGGDNSLVQPQPTNEAIQEETGKTLESEKETNKNQDLVSITENVLTQENSNRVNLGINLGGTQNNEVLENDSTSISLSQITEEIEAKENITSSSDIIDDNQPKEFFKNFNVIDVFAEDKKNKKEDKLNKPQDIVLPQEETKENLSINETNEQNIPVPLTPLTLPIESITPNTSLEDPKIQEDNSPVLEIISENQNDNTPDSTLIEKEIIPEENSTVGNSEIIEVQDANTISNNNQVSDTSQETSNKINDVEQVKKDLSGERKLGGLQFFKKKSVIFSILGILIISGGLGTMFFGGNSETGKTNIQETIIDTNSGKENNENKGTYSEGSDFSINKNRKKNIKKVKPVQESKIEENPIKSEIISEVKTTQSNKQTIEDGKLTGIQKSNDTGMKNTNINTSLINENNDIIDCGNVNYYNFNKGKFIDSESKYIECISKATYECKKAKFNYYFEKVENGIINYEILGKEGDNCKIKTTNNLTKIDSLVCEINNIYDGKICEFNKQNLINNLGKTKTCIVPNIFLNQFNSDINNSFAGISIFSAYGGGLIKNPLTGEEININCN